jgi:hypothetical protein
MLGVGLQRRYCPPVMVLQAWPVGVGPSSPSPAGRLVHSEIARRLAAGGISPVSRAFLFGTQQQRSDVARVVASICLWTHPVSSPPKVARRRRCPVVSGGGAIITHIYKAHADGDTAVHFPDSNLLATGDVMDNRHRLPAGRLRHWRRHQGRDPRHHCLDQARQRQTKVGLGGLISGCPMRTLL